MRPLNYKIIKSLLKQIDTAKSAKKKILQVQQALKNKDEDALMQLGFSGEHATGFHLGNISTIDNLLSRLRYELREIIRISIQSKEATNSDVPLPPTSPLVIPVVITKNHNVSDALDDYCFQYG